MATSPSGRKYIGQTTQTLEQRKRKHALDAKRHDYAFAKAIKKYGVHNMTWDVLEEIIPKEILSEKEELYIKKYNTFKNGYNSTEGGDFNPMDYDENRAKVSERGKGRASSHNQSGERNHQAVLRLDDVSKIRSLYAQDTHSMREIASMFGVSRKNICSIVNNVTWYDKNYTPPKTNISKKYTYRDELSIVRDYKTGKYSSSALAKKYGTCFQSVCYILNKHKDNEVLEVMKKNKRRCKISDKDIGDIMILLNSGAKIQEVSKKYNVSTRTISRRISIHRGKNEL